MDTIEIILQLLRYTPLILMGLAATMLLWIQIRELKRG